uniref:Uncharacterized protein n=1 Tax=Arundo donax TaxID=35708 RepID=A0A0A9AE50_ARUDO
MAPQDINVPVSLGCFSPIEFGRCAFSCVYHLLMRQG